MNKMKMIRNRKVESANLFNKLPRGQTIFLFLLFGQTEINFRIFEYLFDEEQEPLKSLLFQGSH